MALLEIEKVTKRFSGLEALKEVSFQVESGELLGLIGPNGAGKSTLFNVLSGVMSPTSGKVYFQGENITGMKTHRIAAKGLVRTFQSANTLFMNLSVLQNIQVALHIPSRMNMITGMLNISSTKMRKDELRRIANEALKSTGLDGVREELPKNLPHGYQRALGIAIAIMANPKLLCLDEPVTGMNAEETRFMIDLIKGLNKKGITIILVEHTMRVVMGICNRVVVLNFGRKICDGTPSDVQCNNDVIDAYLGRFEENVA